MDNLSRLEQQSSNAIDVLTKTDVWLEHETKSAVQNDDTGSAVKFLRTRVLTSIAVALERQNLLLALQLRQNARAAPLKTERAPISPESPF